MRTNPSTPFPVPTETVASSSSNEGFDRSGVTATDVAAFAEEGAIPGDGVVLEDSATTSGGRFADPALTAGQSLTLRYPNVQDAPDRRDAVQVSDNGDDPETVLLLIWAEQRVSPTAVRTAPNPVRSPPAVRTPAALANPITTT